MRHDASANNGPDRRRATLERLLALEAVNLDSALNDAAQIVAEALGADKVDAFVCEPATETLVARGTSDTPMGRRQHALGLHRLPLADGGRAARVYRSGEDHVDGHVDEDPVELEGIKTGLGVRSAVLTPLEVNGERRGVLSAVSAAPERFSEDDVSFVRAVARWLALVMHRADLVQELVGYAELRGRRQLLMQSMDRLTPRQREVAVLIGGGLTNEQIAQRLVLTPGTVANHVEAILRRLEVDSRTKIAALVAELGLHRQAP
jgi:DNA-binding CsgD family transcriptional regulator